MVSPKQLQFSTPDGASHDTFSVRKSPRTPVSKRAVSDDAGTKEMTKTDKKKRRIKKEKVSSSAINRIWNTEDELVVLKGLRDYKAERGMESKVEWEAFYPLVGDSITAKYSKEQIMSKTRKLKKSFFDHVEKIKQGIDSHSPTFSNAEAFEIAMKLWEKNEDEAGQEMLNENEEALDENEAVENENTKEAQNDEVLKEQNEVANAEQFIDNGADAEQCNDNGADAEQCNDNGAVNGQQNECDKELLLEENEAASSETLNENGVIKITEEVTAEKATEVEIARKASHDADDGVAKQPEKEKQNVEDEFANVQDAFQTLLSHDLSDHRKSLQIEKLRKLENGTRRKLSDEWNAICTMERNLKIRKFEFSAVLAKASKES